MAGLFPVTRQSFSINFWLVSYSLDFQKLSFLAEVNFKAIAMDMRYFTRSMFLRSLVFGFI